MLKTTLSQIQPEINQSIEFIKSCLTKAQKTQLIIAVSGGIDSAVALTLVVKAVGAQNVTAVFLPYGDQDMAAAHQIADFNHLASDHILSFNILPIVQATTEIAGVAETDNLRLGNLMARTRMMLIFDLAKKLEALVCGTENLSEHYLGYFTRFGDEASDIEPIATWFKTEVRVAASALNLPEVFLTKSPSAELWLGQTDEAELGFNYDQADLVLAVWQDLKNANSQLVLDETTIQSVAMETKIDLRLTAKILNRVIAANFKHQVPYKLKT
jgi:NAD+ synthase